MRPCTRVTFPFALGWQGGFDMIGTGRDKIESPQQLASSKAVCEKMDLDGLVVIGGDDSNTNAAVLAEYFKAQKCKTAVWGGQRKVPRRMLF